MTAAQYLAACAALAVFVVGLSALGSVFTVWLLDRPERVKDEPAKPTPRAAHRTPHADKQVTVHHLPPVPVEYLPAQVKPDDGDKTEVRTKVYDKFTIQASPEAARRARDAGGRRE